MLDGVSLRIDDPKYFDAAISDKFRNMCGNRGVFKGCTIGCMLK